MPTFQELLTLKLEALDLQNHPKYKEFMASAPKSVPAAVVVSSTTAETVAEAPVIETPTEPVVDTPVVSATDNTAAPVVAAPDASVVDTAGAVVTADTPAAPPAAPTWNDSTVKAELLVIAGQMGITSVSASNTKAEILSALDAAIK